MSEEQAKRLWAVFERRLFLAIRAYPAFAKSEASEREFVNLMMEIFGMLEEGMVGS